MGAGRIGPTLQFAEPAQAAFQQAAPEVVGWQGPFGTGQRLVQAGFGCIKIVIEQVSAGEVVEHEQHRSEEHTSELQSLMRISYAVFCLKKKTNKTITSMLNT